MACQANGECPTEGLPDVRGLAAGSTTLSAHRVRATDIGIRRAAHVRCIASATRLLGRAEIYPSDPRDNGDFRFDDFTGVIQPGA